jgi:methyltransferase
MAVLPLAFGNWPVALVWSVANAGLLAWRIKVENAALADRERREE